MRNFLLSAVLVLIPIAAAASTLTPSMILANPSMYDGKVVTVSGTVKDVTPRSTTLGNYTKFSLCDTQCITVLDKSQQPHTNKTTATVNATFHASFKGPNKTRSNLLMIGF